jgi:integration host factor subunit alpha
MTKADIVERIHERMRLTKNESAETLETVFSIMKSTLEQGRT